MSELGFFSEGAKCEKERNYNVRREEIVLIAKYALFTTSCQITLLIKCSMSELHSPNSATHVVEFQMN